ncbi:transposase [Oleiphilus messinensis]|uniref:Transposase n=1 Tax=Oleiphilus messinensis TaxID=141451 RepID=A0A1Y0I9Z8_9GAMM|nr:hypothetical protein [Oleiphilus messinensis]ARU57347.1 transposase [Oleiphilus messinensis]
MRNSRKDQPDGLQFNLQDYLELVDWTGRIQREDKRGSISTTLPPILQRLNINAEQWMQLTGKMESLFPTFVSHADRVKIASKTLGHQRVSGLAQCRSLFSTYTPLFFISSAASPSNSGALYARDFSFTPLPALNLPPQRDSFPFYLQYVPATYLVTYQVP